MSDDKLLEAVDRVLGSAGTALRACLDSVISAQDLNALQAARDALRPKEPPTINDLTVEQRLISLSDSATSRSELVGAVADHLRKLYKAYDKDTKAIHAEREATEESLRVLQVRHETGDGGRLEDTMSLLARLYAVSGYLPHEGLRQQIDECLRSRCNRCGRAISPGAPAAGCGCPVEQQSSRETSQPPADLTHTQEASPEKSESCVCPSCSRPGTKAVFCKECIRFHEL